jgi:acetamidase/formamidase
MAETATHTITCAFHEELDEATKTATRDMIGWLGRRHGLSPVDAYTLCSLALDLRVSQVVNPTKGIHAMLPKSVFTRASGDI